MAYDARFAVYRSSDGQYYYYIFRAANGEVLVTSETYVRKQSAFDGIEAFKRSVAGADIVDMTER
ncbi:YegP family protein [Mycolicibacterium sp. GESEQ-9]|uniref:YegP family protein n=1 Tax=Mycolicibacterium sp. GESEQ-9 TaxID=2812656 RepID=UPI001B333703|nr:YegP family protein [Mycolicibacterium sp. GESEQ-9]